MKYISLLIAMLYLSCAASLAQVDSKILQHINKGVEAIQQKDLKKWKTLFLSENKAYDFFSIIHPEILIYEDELLTQYKLESEYLKYQASVVNLFIEQFRDYKQGSYVHIDWTNIVVKDIIMESESIDIGNERFHRYYGWLLLQHTGNKKYYFSSFNNILEIKGGLYGLDLVKEQEIQAAEFPKMVQKIKENGRLPEVTNNSNQQVPSMQTKETSEIYEGIIGNKKVAVYWSSLATDNGTLIIHDVRMVNKDEEEILFEVTTLDETHYILTEEDAKGYYHITKKAGTLEGTWYANDKKTSQKFNLKLKK